ncbi:MAG: S41 family peptidase [Agriterribacter sp.]
MRQFLSVILLLSVICFNISCSKKLYAPSRKFAAEDLKKDYTLLREVLEKFHPALYWYTPKDSMDYFFDKYYSAITDSMTRQQFGFQVLAPLTTKIRCGHTSFSYPAAYNRKMRETPPPSIPLYMKIWPDTMVLTLNLNKKDSILKRGTVITAINGMSEKQLTDTLFQFMPLDGYSENVNYARLSAAFPHYQRNILGLSQSYEVKYIDSAGLENTIIVPVFDPSADSVSQKIIQTRTRQVDPQNKPRRWENIRSLTFDSTNSYAVMTLNSFTGGRLPSFFKKSFRQLKKKNVPNLIIDIRNNGGGNVSNYTSLTKYIRSTPFKVCDTMISNTKKLGGYKQYFNEGWLNSLILFFVSKKEEDGSYHFRYWEKHTFNPREKNHYNGKVFVLISGPTFSASTLFAHAVKGQQNVTIVGEEAGGGAYGNSGIRIPDVILPRTKMKVRLPLFRIVQYQHGVKDGRGVIPDIFVPVTVENIRKNVDGKMKKVTEIILASENNYK